MTMSTALLLCFVLPSSRFGAANGLLPSARASLLPGFDGSMGNKTFDHVLNSSLSFNGARSSEILGGGTGFGDFGSDDFGGGGGGGGYLATLFEIDSQRMLDAAAEQLAGLLMYSFWADVTSIWPDEPTLFLAQNAEDGWFSSIHSIIHSTVGAWSTWSEQWHSAPIVEVESGLSGQVRSVRVASTGDAPTVADLLRVVAKQSDLSSSGSGCGVALYSNNIRVLEYNTAVPLMSMNRRSPVLSLFMS